MVEQKVGFPLRFFNGGECEWELKFVVLEYHARGVVFFSGIAVECSCVVCILFAAGLADTIVFGRLFRVPWRMIVG